METPPRVRYARSGDVRIAYRVLGEGDLDLVLVPGWVSNLDFLWRDPGCNLFPRAVASACPRYELDKYLPVL